MRHALTAFTFVLLAACQSAPEPISDQDNPLTHGNVQMNLVSGETTKDDVLEVFGAPNVTTRDSSGYEVWTYQRHAQVNQSASRSSGWTVLLAGQSAAASGFESSSRVMTLIIKFDDDETVHDFRSRASSF